MSVVIHPEPVKLTVEKNSKPVFSGRFVKNVIVLGCMALLFLFFAKSYVYWYAKPYYIKYGEKEKAAETDGLWVYTNSNKIIYSEKIPEWGYGGAHGGVYRATGKLYDGKYPEIYLTKDGDRLGYIKYEITERALELKTVRYYESKGGKLNEIECPKPNK